MTRRHSWNSTARRLTGALLLALPACDSPERLADDIVAAQEGCTQEELRAGAEECVQMFQRYAEMATEAVHTYIGGMKALNEALERTPDPQFDTTGLGHAFSGVDTTGALYFDGAGDEQPASGLEPFSQPYAPPAGIRSGRGRRPEARGGWPRGWEQPDRRHPQEYADPYAYRDERQEPSYWRPYDDGYDSPHGRRYEEDDDARYGQRYDDYDEAYDGREWGGRQEEYVEPDRGPGSRHGRGILRPPSERLARPWLRPEHPRDPRRHPYPARQPRWSPAPPDTFGWYGEPDPYADPRTYPGERRYR